MSALNGRFLPVAERIIKHRWTERQHGADIDLTKLGKVDPILVTHGHGDHVGDTAALAKMTSATVALNADMGDTFGTLGIVDYKQLIRFNKSGPIKPLKGTPEPLKGALGDMTGVVTVMQPGDAISF